MHGLGNEFKFKYSYISFECDGVTSLLYVLLSSFFLIYCKFFDKNIFLQILLIGERSVFLNRYTWINYMLEYIFRGLDNIQLTLHFFTLFGLSRFKNYNNKWVPNVLFQSYREQTKYLQNTRLIMNGAKQQITSSLLQYINEKRLQNQ